MSDLVHPIPKGKAKPKVAGKAKKPKKPTATWLLNRCDETFGKIVRYPGRCIDCGTTDVIQCAHGFSRRYRATRWDTRNAFPLCRSQHIYFTHRPLEWDQWLRERWGLDLYEELRTLALHGPNPDMAELLPVLRAELDRIERRAA